MKQPTKRKYLLGLLLLVLTFNLVDRVAVGVLMQDIKADLHLSDTQLGILTGLAFALLYSVAGIPIARWADRGNRVSLISLSCAAWSVAVALCGAAGNFLQLLLARVCVGIGEAGCFPPAHSLIADHYDRSERPKAVATFMLGAPLSVVIGYFAGGWLDQFYGWRRTFIALGAPGVIIALLVKLLLRDPRQKAARSQNAGAKAHPAPPLSEVWRILWGNKTFMRMLVAYCFMCFFGFGVTQWMPAFFTRSHGMASGAIGTWFAVVWGICGFVGTYCGGELASRFASGNERLQVRLIGVAFGSLALTSPIIFAAPGPQMAFAAMALYAIAWRSTDGPLLATIQTLTQPRTRAVSIALVFFFGNLVGAGLGPLAAGVLSDVLHPWLGEESLRYALLTLCPGHIVAGWYFWTAGRNMKHDIAATEEAAEADAQQIGDGLVDPRQRAESHLSGALEQRG